VSYNPACHLKVAYHRKQGHQPSSKTRYRSSVLRGDARGKEGGDVLQDGHWVTHD
jgi:hypothetical protein